MYGINIRVQVKPGKVEESAKLLREEIMPAAVNYCGFIQNFLIVDAPNSRLTTLSVWESETDAKAIYEEKDSLYQAAVAKLRPKLAEPPEAWMGPLTCINNKE